MKTPSYLKVHCGLVYLFLYLPVLVLVAFSFNDDKRNVVWKGFTFKWYGSLLGNIELQRALLNSLKVGLVSSLVATVFATLAAMALTRYRFQGQRAVSTLIYLPLAIPEIVMGTSLLTFFVGLGVRLSIGTVIAAHIALSIGYATAAIRSRLAGMDLSVEEAAADLGATPWQVFWLVTFPRILPGVLSGGLLAFTLSFDDFVVTFFTAGIGSGTLPLEIYSMLKFGVTPELNAISTLTLAVTLTALLAWEKLGGSRS